jgi:alpha-glucosidase
MKSEQIDFGYDITDYENIDPIFGTLKDLRQLIIRAHTLGIKIILDFVPNHTSDKHVWFLNSIKKQQEFTNMYVWHNGIPTANLGRPLPPNNWVSI